VLCSPIVTAAGEYPAESVDSLVEGGGPASSTCDDWCLLEREDRGVAGLLTLDHSFTWRHGLRHVDIREERRMVPWPRESRALRLTLYYSISPSPITYPYETAWSERGKIIRVGWVESAPVLHLFSSVLRGCNLHGCLRQLSLPHC
jgi:hypothetical protein